MGTDKPTLRAFPWYPAAALQYLERAITIPCTLRFAAKHQGNAESVNVMMIEYWCTASCLTLYNSGMGKGKQKKKADDNTIARNKKAFHDFFIEDRYEAGISLLGWEVKSMRTARMNLKESYVMIKGGEAFLLGAHIAPLSSASTHVDADPTRTRKLLLHRAELSKLIGLIDRKGYTLVPTAMYWKRGRAKLEIGLAKGKKQHDKRAALKEKDWKREQSRMIKPR